MPKMRHDPYPDTIMIACEQVELEIKTWLALQREQDGQTYLHFPPFEIDFCLAACFDRPAVMSIIRPIRPNKQLTTHPNQYPGD